LTFGKANNKIEYRINGVVEMKKDLVVKQVREIRRKMDRESQNDSDSYFQRLIKIQDGCPGRLVRQQQKPIYPGKRDRVA
jgi:hypothetical protein